MKMKNLQLKIIAVLTVIFFTLIFFSTSKTGLSINYNFEDEVPIQNIGSQLNIAIGDVKINNIGFLTKRVNLTVMCYVLLMKILIGILIYIILELKL